MANSVKLLNWIDPDGEYIKFYTELNSEFNEGDRVFIAGGPYDNTNLANIDPYAEFAAGYTVVAVDKTNLSNSVTLNITHQDPYYQDPTNAAGFAVFNPYYTIEQLQKIEEILVTNVDDLTEDDVITIQRDNYSNEAWISKNHFKRGEFNGGNHSDGIFGEYKIKNSEGEDAPVDDFKTYFNRKEENNNAIWTGGVFLGGNWQWGEWTSKYSATQYGKVQSLNQFGGIKDPLDERKILIQEFNDNYGGQGWNQTISGNFGQVISGEVDLRFQPSSRKIQFSFVPFDLKRLLDTAFNVQIEIDILDEINDIRNNRKFTIDYDPSDDNDVSLLHEHNTVVVFERIYSTIGTATSPFIPANVIVTVADPEQTLLDEIDIIVETYRAAKASDDYEDFNELMESKKLKNIEPYKTEKLNNFSTGRFQDCDYFNGLWYNPEFWQVADFRGGDWWNGEMKFGRIGSRYKKTIWHNGFVNGVVNRTFANDLFWENGLWLNGTWDGARRFKVDSLILAAGNRTQIQTSLEWGQMFEIDDTIFLSYFKGSNSTQYLQNWTDNIYEELIEFQTFPITDILVDVENRRTLITIPFDLNSLSAIQFVTNIYGETVLDLNYGFSKDIYGQNVINLNYGFARISNSYFNKGIWIDGTWNTGYLNGKLNEISEIHFDVSQPDVLAIKTDDISNLRLGDYIELANIKVIHLFDFTGLLPGTNIDDRNNVEYWQNLDQILQVFDIDIDNNILYLDLSNLNNDIAEDSVIINIEEYYPNAITSWSYQVWENGTYHSGALEDVIWKNGLVDNIFVQDPTNTQIKVVWRSGVWKNGTWENGTFLSGIWEDGTWNNGFMTNGWKRSTEFWLDETSWQQSDSVWMNGNFNNGRWIRGVWNDGSFNGGTIENGGFDKIEINGGIYTNGRTNRFGRPVYSEELNVNRSLGAAPSLVFIDSEGWVQCDQSSWYQRDYNIIFQDLDTNPDDGINDGFPWNEQMFDVLDRDETAAKLRISTIGVETAGTNGTAGCSAIGETGVPQEIIDLSLPIAVVRNIVEIVEISANIFWIADGSGRVLEQQENGSFQIQTNEETGEDLIVNGYDRILQVDQTGDTNVMQLIQKVVNDDSDFSLDYDNILRVEKDPDSDYSYTLEGTVIQQIHTTTLDNKVVATFISLAQDTNIQLVAWYNILVFPERTNIPETIFLFGTFITGTTTKFDILAIYPNISRSPEFISYLNSTFYDMFNQWQVALTLNDSSYFDVNIKGYSSFSQFNLYEKLPFDIDTYEANNIQKQTLSYQEGVWTMITINQNYLDNILDDENALLFIDYAVHQPATTEEFFFLDATTRADIYINVDNVLTPFLNNLPVTIKAIEFGETSLLAVLTDNVTPLIIPEDIRRTGVGVADVDPDNISDPIQYLEYQQRTLEVIITTPTEGDLQYWLWDYPTKRVLRIDETNPLFYDENGEFGVEPPKFNRLLFINKSDDSSNKLIYFEKNISGNVIATLDATQNDSTEIIETNQLGSLKPDTETTTTVFVDAYYFDGNIYVLYYVESNNVRQYKYDVQSMTTGVSEAEIEIPNDAGNVNVIQPIHMAASGELTQNASITRNKVYFADPRAVISNEAQIIFDPVITEVVSNIAIYSQGARHYMYIATVEDEMYRIYRLTKFDISDSITEWPSNVDTIDFTRTVAGVVYETSDKIYSMKSTVKIENFEGIEILTENGFVLLANEYISTQIKNTLRWIEFDELDTDTQTSEVVKYAYDSSNRIIRFTSGNPLQMSTEYGQYLQPFQYESYIRNATGIHAIQWIANATNQFIVFVDEKIENVYVNNALAGYKETKKYVRALKIDNNLANVTSAEIVTMFDGDLSLESIRDPYGKLIYQGTNGVDMMGNYTVNDLWASSSTNTASIYYLILDNNTEMYQLVLMNSQISGEFSVEFIDIDANSNDYQFTGFNVSRKELNTSNGDVFYVNDLTKVYELEYTSTSGSSMLLVNEIVEVSAIINEVAITPDLDPVQSRDFVYLDVTESISAGTAGTISEKHLYVFIKAANQPVAAVYDDDGKTLFRTMNSIDIAANRQSVLIAQQFGVDTVTLVMNAGNIVTDVYGNATYTLDAADTVDPGTEEYEYSEYLMESLPSFKTLFEPNPLFHSYYIEEDGTLYSPVVNGRVMYNMIWGGDSWNSGEDTRNLGYTAHLVASKWTEGSFTGSWDTPNFFNHYVLRTDSIFLGGVFGNTTDNISGIWNDGLFLGGTWTSGTFNRGHFISESEIVVDSIDFPGGPDTYNRVNQVINAQYDFDCKLFRLDLEHFYWDATQYIDAESRLSQHMLIRVPGLFQDWELEIEEIRENIIQIEGQNEITLITSLPDFEIPDGWLVGSTIYAQGFQEYIAFLHGTHYVTHSFVFNTKLWVTIISDFDEFDDNGRYEIDYEPLPYLSMDPFRIEKIVKDDNHSSRIWIDVPLPPGTEAEQMEFLKENLIISSLDLIETEGAKDFGTVVSPEQVQVFDRSAQGGPSSIQFNSVSSIQGMLFDGVNQITYTGTTSIKDLVLINSVLNETTSVNIQNSLIYSGRTNVNIQNTGWLNQDRKGFGHGKSEFIGNLFDSDQARILQFNIEDDNEYLWVELERPLANISKNQFIFLRGFSGNKARLIGSSFSQTFRIQEVNTNRIKIRNPFKLYNEDNIAEDRLYRTKFNIGELLLYEKTMQLDQNTYFTFFYAYASNSAWNGGLFSGDDSASPVPTFSSIWNAGQFNANVSSSIFNGEWFATPYCYYYTGNLQIEVDQHDADFELIIDLIANGIHFHDGDLLYVEFQDPFPEPFYAKIKDGKVSNVYPIFYPEGTYEVTLIRYHAADVEDDFDQLILDQNLDIGPEKNAIYHTVFETKTFDYADGNTALQFKQDPNNVPNGILMFNIKYILKALSTQTTVFDLELKCSGVTQEQTVLFFQLSDTISVRILLDRVSTTNYIRVRYQETTDPTETSALDAYIQASHIVTATDWNHLYVEYLPLTKVTKLILNGTDIYTIDSLNNGANDSGNSANWNLEYINNIDDYHGIPFDKNSFSNIKIGQGGTEALISSQGYLDHLRFWNQPLDDRTSTSDTVSYIIDKKFLSYVVREIDVKLTFDDRTAEFLVPFKNDAIILSEAEYINALELPTDFLIFTELNIQQLKDLLQLFRFEATETKQFLIEREADIVKLKIDDDDPEKAVDVEIQLSTYFQMFIRENRLIILVADEIVFDQEIDLSLSTDVLNIGNSSTTSYDASVFILNTVTVFNQNSDEFIAALIDGQTSSFTSDSVVISLNPATISNVSSDFLIYPPSSEYGTIQQSTDTTEPGSALVTIEPDYQEWIYLYGDSIYNTTLSDSSGSNLEIWGTNGQPVLDYYDAEIFQLDEYGEPVWSIDNVVWQSRFINGEYESKLWRAGEFSGGFIRNTRFIWKWGINSGGGIIDTST